jgi:predicted dehydrogenase
MIHDIDIVINLLGESNPEIHAIGTPVTSPFTDIADVHLRFNNHCEVHLKASRVSVIKERIFKLFEPNRCLVADFIQQNFTVYHKENEKILINRKEGDKRDILDYQVRHFIDSVAQRTAPLVSGEEGLETLRLVDKIRNSLKEPSSKEHYVYGHTLRRSEQAI